MKKTIYLLSITLAIFLISCSSESKKEVTKDEKTSSISVEITEMEKQDFKSYITVNGNVEAINDVQLRPEIPGRIKSIIVKEGDKINKGQLLVSLKTDATEKGIQEIKTGLELATIMFEKQKSLWEQKIGTEVQFLQAKNQKEALENKLATLNAQLEMAQIKAPFSGIIDEIYQKDGDFASAQMPILHIIDLSKMKIKAPVSESYISTINKGDSIDLLFPAYPKMETIKTIINRTGNNINPANRTFLITVLLNNINDKLKPYLIAEVKLTILEIDSTYIVPTQIIKSNLKKENFIFIAEDKDNQLVAKKIFVNPIATYNGNTVIESDEINDGTKVIVKGYNLVSNNKSITIYK